MVYHCFIFVIASELIEFWIILIPSFSLSRHTTLPRCFVHFVFPFCIGCHSCYCGTIVSRTMRCTFNTWGVVNNGTKYPSSYIAVLRIIVISLGGNYRRINCHRHGRIRINMTRRCKRRNMINQNIFRILYRPRSCSGRR